MSLYTLVNVRKDPKDNKIRRRNFPQVCWLEWEDKRVHFVFSSPEEAREGANEFNRYYENENLLIAPRRVSFGGRLRYMFLKQLEFFLRREHLVFGKNVPFDIYINPYQYKERNYHRARLVNEEEDYDPADWWKQGQEDG